VSSPPPGAPPSATPRVSRTTSPATGAGAGAYQPPSAPRAAATLHSGATPTPGRTFTSRRLVPPPHGTWVWSGWRGWHRSPPWPWPWHLSRHHRHR
jgi:hypothetical protein